MSGDEWAPSGIISVNTQPPSGSCFHCGHVVTASSVDAVVAALKEHINSAHGSREFLAVPFSVGPSGEEQVH